MTRYLLTPLVAVVAAGSVSAAPRSPVETLELSSDVLDGLAALPLKGIPPALLADAHGVAVIPRVIKGGLVVGGRAGHGVVLTRDKDGNWVGPTFVAFGGASVGLQIGVESADVVLVFKTRKSLDRVLDGKGKLTLGADASIAAGPVGRQMEAATDGRLQAEIVSYSRTRGLFAGVALDGAALTNDKTANGRFQQTATRPEEVAAVRGLLTRLTAMTAPPPGAGAGPPPVAVMAPPAVVPVNPPRTVPVNPPPVLDPPVAPPSQPGLPMPMPGRPGPAPVRPPVLPNGPGY